MATVPCVGTSRVRRMKPVACPVGVDERINAAWPAYEAALKAAGARYTAHVHAGAQHGFNNDTTPRFDAAAAKLAWERTMVFFNQTLKA